MLDAAENGKLDTVKMYYRTNPALIQCVDKDGYTALHRACYGNHPEVVKVNTIMLVKINS